MFNWSIQPKDNVETLALEARVCFYRPVLRINRLVLNGQLPEGLQTRV